MDMTQTLTMRLEAYLLQLTDWNQRWQEWLTSTESAVVLNQANQLLTLQDSGQQLIENLRSITADRESILASASQSGWSASNLATLARQLPIWQRPRFRDSFEKAKRQLQHLRRLHIASWVLLGQSANYCQEVTQLLTSGSTRQDVYLENSSYDTGGQLLDAQL
jgi:hypothetical protein